MGCCHSKVRSKKEVRSEDSSELVRHEAREGPVPNMSTADKLTDQEIIRQALEIYLPDYKFRYSPSGAKSNRETSIMEFANKPNIIVTPGSDNSNLLLSYGKDNTNYLLLGTNQTDNDKRKFVYTLTTESNEVLTSPFHTTGMNDGSTVPCSQSSDITSALLDATPVMAVVEVLNNSFQELKDDDFIWNLYGPENDFSVATEAGNDMLYWEGIDTSDIGNILLTIHNGNKLQLNIISLDN